VGKVATTLQEPDIRRSPIAVWRTVSRNRIGWTIAINRLLALLGRRNCCSWTSNRLLVALPVRCLKSLVFGNFPWPPLSGKLPKSPFCRSYDSELALLLRRNVRVADHIEHFRNRA
jgi:hypothetical protein